MHTNENNKSFQTHFQRLVRANLWVALNKIFFNVKDCANLKSDYFNSEMDQSAFLTALLAKLN